jgi:hypothetical protein
MSTRFADLHLHTYYSDGTDSPADLVARAKACGLDCIALTDHDTIDGIPETRTAADGAGIEFIPGVEITAHLNEQELHILGYQVDWQDPEFCRQMKHFQSVRRERVERMVVRLNELGVPITLDQITRESVRGSLGRPHVARALCTMGFVSSTQEAFSRFLGRGKPACVPKWKPTVTQVAQIIRDAGGVSVLAHPGLAGVDDRIEDLKNLGIRGLEVFHTSHSAEQRVRYQKIAEQMGLVITGGSDCHGQSKGKATLGLVKLSYEYVEKLREAAGSQVKSH